MIIKDKVAIVTGGASGIGLAIAKKLSEEGAKVVIASRDQGEGQNIESQVPNSTYIQTDVTDLNSIKNLMEKVKEKFGRLDILVNNAGIEKTSPDPLDTVAWHDVFAVNLFGYVEMARAALKLMTEGAIINISSIAGSLNIAFTEDSMAYSVSKAAVDKFTIQLAASFHPKIRVNAISPGYVLTPMWDPFPEEFKKDAVNDVPMKRFIQPEEIAQMAIAILENDMLTSQIITIDGGISLKEIK